MPLFTIPFVWPSDLLRVSKSAQKSHETYPEIKESLEMMLCSQQGSHDSANEIDWGMIDQKVAVRHCGFEEHVVVAESFGSGHIVDLVGLIDFDHFGGKHCL